MAASMTIGSSQIKSLLGLKGATNTFIEAWSGVFRQIHETKLWDPLLGVVSILILVLLKVNRAYHSRVANRYARPFHF